MVYPPVVLAIVTFAPRLVHEYDFGAKVELVDVDITKHRCLQLITKPSKVFILIVGTEVGEVIATVRVAKQLLSKLFTVTE